MLLAFIITAAALFFILHKKSPTPSSPIEGPPPAEVSNGDVVVAAPEFAPREVEYGPAKLTLDSGTEIRFASPRVSVESEVVLLKGRLTATVRPLQKGESFKVSTFNVTAGVRGTKFTVAIIGGIFTIVQVIEGHVWIEAATGTPVMLEPGQEAHIHGIWEPEIIDSKNKDRSVDDLSSILNQPPPIEEPAAGASTTTEGGGVISGEGTWSNNLGFAGSVLLSIDLKKGSYTGTFHGENKAGANTARVVTLDGKCGGSYKGDASSGSLDGWIEFVGTDPASGRRTPGMRGRASGTLQNGSITGSYEGAQEHGEFTVKMK